MNEFFRLFSNKISQLVGTPASFLLAVLIILGWAVTGPLFQFSDTWQLVINTGTTIVTFLMVFVIQNTQNRESKAIHLKLDELIRSSQDARNTVIDLEHMSDDELNRLETEFHRLRQRQEDLAIGVTKTVDELGDALEQMGDEVK